MRKKYTHTVTYNTTPTRGTCAGMKLRGQSIPTVGRLRAEGIALELRGRDEVDHVAVVKGHVRAEWNELQQMRWVTVQ